MHLSESHGQNRIMLYFVNITIWIWDHMTSTGSNMGVRDACTLLNYQQQWLDFFMLCEQLKAWTHTHAELIHFQTPGKQSACGLMLSICWWHTSLGKLWFPHGYGFLLKCMPHSCELWIHWIAIWMKNKQEQGSCLQNPYCVITSRQKWWRNYVKRCSASATSLRVHKWTAFRPIQHNST